MIEIMVGGLWITVIFIICMVINDNGNIRQRIYEDRASSRNKRKELGISIARINDRLYELENTPQRKAEKLREQLEDIKRQLGELDDN